MEDLYDTLGVDKSATAEEIKSAYKNKAKENHPDKNGGSTEKMQAINKAYKILSNADKRSRYDSTGATDEETPFKDKFSALVNQVLLNIVSTAKDVRRYDVVGHFNHYVNENIAGIKKEKGDTTKEIQKLEEVKKRIKSKKDKTFIIILDQHILEKKRFLSIADLDIEFLTKAKEVLADYEYEMSLDDNDRLANILLTNLT